MLCGILEKKLSWFDARLELNWKSYSRNKKSRKRKKEKKVKGRGTKSGPALDPAHGPPKRSLKPLR
jgi:hypothetical protein